MRLRAQILVDIAADDFVQAADHQKHLGDFLEQLRERYPHAIMSIRERRERKPDPVVQPLQDARRTVMAGGQSATGDSLTR